LCATVIRRPGVVGVRVSRVREGKEGGGHVGTWERRAACRSASSEESASYFS